MTRTNSSNQDQTALITGASGGIGLELARVFAQADCNLVIVARSEQKLADLAAELEAKHGITVNVIVKDLSEPASPDEIYAELQAKGISIDILVNNAGFADYGLFAQSDLDKQLRMMQVNMVTLTHLTRLLVPGMIERGQGKILNLASTAAFQPGPLMSVYYATKAYVLSFSEAIANELKDAGVTVTALCPGPTASGFQTRANMEDSKLVNNQEIMDAATVARAGYQGLMAGDTVVIPGLKNRLLALVPRFLPRDMVAQLTRNVQASIHEN